MERLLRSGLSTLFAALREKAAEIDDHSHRAEIRFARPNIQIYDAHVVDLY
jgi:hypothetical protein